MHATLIFKEKSTDLQGNLTDAVVWKVPVDDKYPQGVRYRLAFVSKGHPRPAVLYDNHHPKGHHKHIEKKEFYYEFAGLQQLMLDFENDIFEWKSARRHSL